MGPLTALGAQIGPYVSKGPSAAPSCSLLIKIYVDANRGLFFLLFWLPIDPSVRQARAKPELHAQ